jgi:signal transduction histidine kinase
MSQNQRMGFPGSGGTRGGIVGANRTLRLWIAFLAIAVFGLASLYRSLAEPSLGWRFTVGTEGQVTAVPAGLSRQPPLQGVGLLSAGTVNVPLDASLVIESAGIHNDYDVHNRFFAEHRRLWEVLHAPEVTVHHASGAATVAARPRGIDELGLRFWFPWLVGLLSLSVGLAIWVYRPRSSASLCYLVASSGYAFGMLCTASWGSRLLTQPPQGWAALHVASHLGSYMVTLGLCSLLWLHPRRLGGNWLLWTLPAVVAMSLAAELGQWVPTISLAFRLPIVLMTVLLAALFALQWRACRADPIQRAQLKWFGLLMFVSLSTVFVAYSFGAAGRVLAMPQNYGLGVVALLFVGLVPLVTRVGLFQLEAWWPRAWLWFLGGLLVVALDLGLVVALDLSATNALAVALALAGWLYFPLRQMLWRRMSRGALPVAQEVLPRILELVTQRQGDRASLNQRWRQLWDDLFQPARMRLAPADTQSGISDEGRLLAIPACDTLDAFLLELPERGARLFNPADLRRANEIHELVQQGMASGEAFDRGARLERQRIASDLHDDLGAKLLTIAQASGSERVASMARQALDEMRLSVRGLVGDASLAADVLADWRAECVTRLAAAGFQAHWEAGEPPEGMVLPARAHVQLTRVLREALSNAIRHSRGQDCTVRIGFEADRIHMEIEDDGCGLPGKPPSTGHGLASIERRVRQLHGEHSFDSGANGGTRLRLMVPLVVQSATMESI